MTNEEVKELFRDVDADRGKALRMFNEMPVEYIEQGSFISNLWHRKEYAFCFNDKKWECKRPYEEPRMIRGTIPDEAVKRFFNDVLWIAGADDRQLNPDSRAIDAASYSLSVFGKKLFWDASAIDENGDPRYNKLNEAINRLIGSLKKDD